MSIFKELSHLVMNKTERTTSNFHYDTNFNHPTLLPLKLFEPLLSKLIVSNLKSVKYKTEIIPNYRNVPTNKQIHIKLNMIYNIIYKQEYVSNVLAYSITKFERL